MSTLPVYVSMVAPKRRMSGSVFDAENCVRVVSGMPAWSAEAQPVNSELEWKNGNGRVHDVVGGRARRSRATCAPGAGEATLGATHRLREAGRTRREDEQEEIVVGAGSSGTRRWRAVEASRYSVGVDDEYPMSGTMAMSTPSSSAIEATIGHDELTVAVVG